MKNLAIGLVSISLWGNIILSYLYYNKTTTIPPITYEQQRDIAIGFMYTHHLYKYAMCKEKDIPPMDSKE
jgi:hypothetical protein